MRGRAQVEAATRFRSGEVNVLLATSIAEEGLDIPECNVVIRFDVMDHVIGLIQSRGRARNAEAHFDLVRRAPCSSNFCLQILTIDTPVDMPGRGRREALQDVDGPGRDHAKGCL